MHWFLKLLIQPLLEAIRPGVLVEIGVEVGTVTGPLLSWAQANGAVVHAIDTSGRAVLFAGGTVVISLLGLFLIGLSFIRGLSIGAALAAGCTVVCKPAEDTPYIAYLLAEVLAAADAAPDDLAAQSLAADVEVLSGEAERGYGRLVEFVRRSSGPDRDAARNHLVSLFTVAGPDDPAVAAARRALASALF